MDPYELCPCGSRKKVKFCCLALVPEMEKVERLQENNQPRMALQLLERLDKSHPGNAWVVTRLAMALLVERRYAEAEAVLVPFLRTRPEHALANVLYGVVVFCQLGYPEARRAVHRAFRYGANDYGAFVASLAKDVGMRCLEEGHFLSARQHLALSLRWAPSEFRQSAFDTLLRYDADADILYPLRGPQQVPLPAHEGALGEALVRAQQLSTFGCWQEAAERLQTAIEGADHPSPEAWHLLALYRAWDGDDPAAAAAFHHAAGLYEDFETAVECETLAQLLDLLSPEQKRRVSVQQFEITSASRLLTLLDASPRLVRAPALAEESEAPEGGTTSSYLILDREAPDRDQFWTLDALPRSLGTITIWSDPEKQPPEFHATVVAIEGEMLDESVRLFTSIGGEMVSEEDTPHPLHAASELPLVFEPFYFPEGTRPAEASRFEEEAWNRAIYERFPAMPWPGLGGRTPMEAIDDPALRVPLAAAINVLDVLGIRRGRRLPIAALRERFHLPAPAPIRLDAQGSIGALSCLQLQRLDMASLDAAQLEQLVKRAMLLQHPRLMQDVLTHALSRDGFESSLERQTMYQVLAGLCGRQQDTAGALQWIARGQAEVLEGPQRFEKLLEWKLHEVRARSNQPVSPEFEALLVELWQHYATKVPWLQEVLYDLVRDAGIEPPWERAIVTASDLSAIASGAWSPGEPAAAGAGEKKLWLPGDR